MVQSLIMVSLGMLLIFFLKETWFCLIICDCICHLPLNIWSLVNVLLNMIEKMIFLLADLTSLGLMEVS